MRILITGGEGQLGYDLNRVLSQSPERFEIYLLSKKALNVTDSSQVMEVIERIKPDVILHAAAYTYVDLAETEKETAYQVNAFGTKNVAIAAASIQAKLVYISTDYVFDGKKGTPYTELDLPQPIGIYGSSKLLGEKFVAALTDHYFIVRTAWLYSIHGNNFVKKIAVLSKVNAAPITAVVDQIGSPTYALDLAHFIAQLMQTDKYGLYHATNEGYCTKYAFVQEIIKVLQAEHVPLLPANLKDFKLPAQRPVNSALDHYSIRTNQFPCFRHWKTALHDFITNELNTKIK